MALNPATLLAEVEAAISALLSGEHQSYSIGGRAVTRLDLSELFEQRRMLQAEIARESGGSFIRLARMGRPR